MTDPSVELALAELTRKIDVGFAKVDGQLALFLQQTQEMKTRADHQAAALDRLDSRVDSVEMTRVTRDELDARDGRLREEMTEQRAQDAESARRALMLWGLVVTIAMGLLGAGVAVAGLLIK